MVIFAKIVFIWSLIWKVKVTYMPIASFICLLFNVSAFFFSSWVEDTDPHSHPNRGSKWTHISSWKNGQNLINVFPEAYFPRWASLVYQMLVLYSEYLLSLLFFQFLRYGIHLRIPILTVVKKGRIAGSKMVIFL